jgi:glyoxalase family protein
MELTGIHHLTAVSARIRENYRFYTEVMGMRLVKRSVNQDDVSAYHLFYADALGTPGTDLTFFDWSVPREVRGTRSIVRTSLRVHGDGVLDWWRDRLAAAELAVGTVTERDGRGVLDFEDPEGQRLTLVEDGGAGDPPVPWEESPVLAPRQIRGLGPILLSVPDLANTEEVLTRVMNMEKVREYSGPASDAVPVDPTTSSPSSQGADPDGDGEGSPVHVFQMGEGGPHAELHVAVEPHLPPVRPGAGGVHHVAFRVPNREAYDAWADRLNELRVPNSGKVDRFYFRSLYFREPSGILFELATDGPGFAVDEDPETLGESVALPPFLESRREEIVGNLKPID